MNKLKPCPYCGGEAELCYSEVDTFCRKCNVMQETELWNTRPIEDALNARIAELEGELGKDVDLTIVGLRKELLNAQSRIAELEAERERFTVHSDIERQDDKSPNDKLTARIAELEGLVERLIELGDVINGDKESVWTLRTVKERWTEDVTKWKEREG